jgi:hypothetical protein
VSLHGLLGGVDPLRYDPIALDLGLASRPEAERRSLAMRRTPTSLHLGDVAEPPLERPHDVDDSDAWLARLVRVVEPPEGTVPREPRAARIDRAVYIVLETLDDLLFARNEVRCQEILERTDVERLPIEVLLALLGGTLRAREALGAARDLLCRRVEEKLRRDAPTRVELLLRGLR